MTVTGYEVVVKGRFGSALASAFEGFEVARVDHGCTHLVGWATDQARLHSMLERLRDLNIELISVNRLPGAGQPRRQEDLGLRERLSSDSHRWYDHGDQVRRL